jgi:hypothetical protein
MERPGDKVQNSRAGEQQSSRLVVRGCPLLLLLYRSAALLFFPDFLTIRLDAPRLNLVQCALVTPNLRTSHPLNRTLE